MNFNITHLPDIKSSSFRRWNEKKEEVFSHEQDSYIKPVSFWRPSSGVLKEFKEFKRRSKGVILGWGAFRIFWAHTFAPPSKVSYLCIEHKKWAFLGTGLFLTLQLNVKDLYRVYYRKYCQKWVKIQISTMACRLLEMIYTSFRAALCTLVLCKFQYWAPSADTSGFNLTLFFTISV